MENGHGRISTHWVANLGEVSGSLTNGNNLGVAIGPPEPPTAVKKGERTSRLA